MNLISFDAPIIAKTDLQIDREEVRKRIKAKNEQGLEELSILEKYVYCEDTAELHSKNGDEKLTNYWRGRTYSYWDILCRLQRFTF